MSALPMQAGAAPGRARGAARARAVLWFAAAVLIGFHFALNLQQSGRIYLHTDAYTQLQEKRPYQYRVLMAPVVGALMHALAQPPARAVLGKLPVYVATPEAGAYVAINAVGFAASLLLMAAIARRVLTTTAAVRAALLLYLGLAYLFFCLNPNVAFILPYDVPSLVLSQACLLSVLTRRWRWLFPLFVVATVNRESSFLVIVFLTARAAFDPAPRRFAVPIAALCALWLAVKLALFGAFSSLPSDEGFRLAYNLRTLGRPWQWPALLPLFASLALALASLRALRAQREWAITGGVGFALVFLVGQVIETRAFGELITFFALAITLGMKHAPEDRTRIVPA